MANESIDIEALRRVRRELLNNMELLPTIRIQFWRKRSVYGKDKGVSTKGEVLRHWKRLESYVIDQNWLEFRWEGIVDSSCQYCMRQRGRNGHVTYCGDGGYMSRTCPIMRHTGLSACDDTPWDRVADAASLAHYNIVNKETKGRLNPTLYNELLEAIREQIAFLEEVPDIWLTDEECEFQAPLSE